MKNRQPRQAFADIRWLGAFEENQPMRARCEKMDLDVK